MKKNNSHPKCCICGDELKYDEVSKQYGYCSLEGTTDTVCVWCYLLKILPLKKM